MPNRVRKYSFEVKCPLPATKLGEERSMTTFVYDVRTKPEARRLWFALHLRMARKNGLRGSTQLLKRKLNLDIHRIQKRPLVTKVG